LWCSLCRVPAAKGAFFWGLWLPPAAQQLCSSSFGCCFGLHGEQEGSALCDVAMMLDVAILYALAEMFLSLTVPAADGLWVLIKLLLVRQLQRGPL